MKSRRFGGFLFLAVSIRMMDAYFIRMFLANIGI